MKIEFEPKSSLIMCCPLSNYYECENGDAVEISIADGNVHESDICLVIPKNVASDIYDTLREVLYYHPTEAQAGE